MLKKECLCLCVSCYVSCSVMCLQSLVFLNSMCFFGLCEMLCEILCVLLLKGFSMFLLKLHVLLKHIVCFRLYLFTCAERQRKLTRCHEKPNKSSHEIKSSHEMQVTRCICSREYTRWKSQELSVCVTRVVRMCHKMYMSQMLL